MQGGGAGQESQVARAPEIRQQLYHKGSKKHPSMDLLRMTREHPNIKGLPRQKSPAEWGCPSSLLRQGAGPATPAAAGTPAGGFYWGHILTSRGPSARLGFRGTRAERQA